MKKAKKVENSANEVARKELQEMREYEAKIKKARAAKKKPNKKEDV
mgnify:CR=1 FL=1|jgi:hypothetical protein|tara:strand:- start:536 stop:673 length:138 start_codon:yes stop_codon:yes gene_type:complete